MIWNIITDSSCDLSEYSYKDENNEIRYYQVPFVITAGGRDFIDDESLNLEDMMVTMENDEKASKTSCPSPMSWLELFKMEGNVLAITISKELSGSYNSACAAKDMLLEEDPEKKIHIVNSVSAGAGLILIHRNICEMIKNGLDFEEIVEKIETVNKDKRTIFALCSFKNLVKNGRMSPIAGFIARKLGFWGIGVASDIGTIVIKGKVRGSGKAVSGIVDDMIESGRKVNHVIITHCQNNEASEIIKGEVLSKWPDAVVEIHDTQGLCSYYAERHGFILAYN